MQFKLLTQLTKSYGVTIQMKRLRQYFCISSTICFLILYKTEKFAGEIWHSWELKG